MVLPAPSVAVTVMAFDPEASPMLVTLQLVVPEAVPLPDVAGFAHVTVARPEPPVSEALPVSVTVDTLVM